MESNEEHQVYKQLDRLNELLALTNKYLDELEKKLEPVSAPYPVAGVMSTDEKLGLVPLAASLNDTGNTVDKIVNKILEITTSVRL